MSCYAHNEIARKVSNCRVVVEIRPNKCPSVQIVMVRTEGLGV